MSNGFLPMRPAFLGTIGGLVFTLRAASARTDQKSTRYVALLASGLVLVHLGAACAPTSAGGTPRTTAREARERARQAPPDPLADESIALAGGALRARLPRGAVAASDPRAVPTPAPGMLVPSVHIVQRETGSLHILARDTGELGGPDFRTYVEASELDARCVASGGAVPAAFDAHIAGGIEIIGFTATESCPGTTAPSARLWVRTAEGNVSTITFSCLDDGCFPDRTSILGHFVASLAPGSPQTAPAGTRTFGPSDDLMITVTVPEGYVVRYTHSATTDAYEIFERQPMGSPWTGASFTFVRTPSPNPLRDDYGRADARMRMVGGKLAGRRTHFLEIRYGERTERFARVRLGEGEFDVGIVGATPTNLRVLGAILNSARLPRP